MENTNIIGKSRHLSGRIVIIQGQFLESLLLKLISQAVPILIPSCRELIFPIYGITKDICGLAGDKKDIFENFENSPGGPRWGAIWNFIFRKMRRDEKEGVLLSSSPQHSALMDTETI